LNDEIVEKYLKKNNLQKKKIAKKKRMRINLRKTKPKKGEI
jgi:hypothetical protein